MTSDTAKITHPLVSIITVVLNGAQHIETTIKSVLRQDYPNIEYIIIDGGSTDGTLEIIKRYETNISKWISEPDKGIYDAMNKGIRMAKGDWVGILNSDDFYYPGAIRTLMESQGENKAEIIHGSIMQYMETETLCLMMPHTPDFSKIKEQMNFYQATSLTHRKVFEQIGYFDIGYVISADYEFVLRALKKGIRFHMVENIISGFRIGGISCTTCRSDIENYRIAGKYNTGQQYAYLFRYIKCSVKRTMKNLLIKLHLHTFLERRAKRIWNR